MLIKELKKLILKKELLTVELGEVTGAELTGIPVKIDSENVLLAQITEQGEYNGITLFPTEHITEVCWGNREHQSIKKLVADQILSRSVQIKTMEFDDALIELFGLYKFVGIYGYDEEDFNIVSLLEYDEEWLKLKCLGNKKTLSVINRIMKREDICRAVVDSPSIHQIVKLHGTKASS